MGIKALTAVFLMLIGNHILGIAHNVEKLIVCSSTAICFSRTATTLPFQAFQVSIPRGVCHNLTAPNETGFIDNNGPTQWRVFVDRDCRGTMGTILSHSEGPMRAPFLNSIDSTYRTSSL